MKDLYTIIASLLFPGVLFACILYGYNSDQQQKQIISAKSFINGYSTYKCIKTNELRADE